MDMALSDDRPIQFDKAAEDRRSFERHVTSGAVTRVELAPPVARVAWSGVWAGFLICLGIWLVLSSLGAAIGLSTIGPRLNVSGLEMGGATTAWVYVSALVALFFGAGFGARLALVVDGTVACLEATLIWTFALVLVTIAATTFAGIAAAHPAATQGMIQANPGATSPGAAIAGAWLTFLGIVVAWIVSVLGSFWGRAQARGRAQQLGLAA
jgi:hypothetical protein